MLGVTDQHGIPIRKSWRIACTFPIVALQDKICDGNHMHGESRGQALKIAESYTFSMTDAIHREFARHVNSRTSKALPVTYLPACCCVARSDPWPMADNYHPVAPQGVFGAEHIEDGIGCLDVGDGQFRIHVG